MYQCLFFERDLQICCFSFFACTSKLSHKPCMYLCDRERRRDEGSVCTGETGSSREGGDGRVEKQRGEKEMKFSLEASNAHSGMQRKH